MNPDERREVIVQACRDMAAGLAIVDRVPAGQEKIREALLSFLKETMLKAYEFPAEFLDRIRAYNQGSITIEQLADDFTSAVRKRTGRGN